jgi:uncharacterized protein with FMN-binding domain
MKKILLSAIVIIGFISYALYIRTKGVATMPIVTSKTMQSDNLTANPTKTPIPTGTPATLPTTQSTATPQSITPTATPQPSSQYKDGTYIGSVADAFYGNIQVQITITGGKITTVQFLQYPNDNETSRAINQQADPMLSQEAIKMQQATVDVVSGATQSSQAFIQSMQSALSQAKS